MIEKRYKDIDAGWFTPDQEAVVNQLRRLLDDPEFALARIRTEGTVQTSHAYYRERTTDERASKANGNGNDRTGSDSGVLGADPRAGDSEISDGR